MPAAFIPLNAEDRAAAWACAKGMVADARRVGARDRMGENSQTSHYHGALGEIAVSRSLGLPWACHSLDFNKPDVGPYEVRTVGPKTRAYVKTKANDPADRPIVYVLLCAGPGGAIVMGVIAGTILPARLRKVGTRRDPGGHGAPAYFGTLGDLTPWEGS